MRTCCEMSCALIQFKVCRKTSRSNSSFTYQSPSERVNDWSVEAIIYNESEASSNNVAGRNSKLYRDIKQFCRMSIVLRKRRLMNMCLDPYRVAEVA